MCIKVRLPLKTTPLCYCWANPTPKNNSLIFYFKLCRQQKKFWPFLSRSEAACFSFTAQSLNVCGRARSRPWGNVDISALQNDLVKWRRKLAYVIISWTGKRNETLEMTHLRIFSVLHEFDLEGLEIKLLPQNPQPAFGPNDKHRSTSHSRQDT